MPCATGRCLKQSQAGSRVGEMDNFACPCCGTSSNRTIGDLLRHIRLFHADSSHFSIQCNKQGCQRTFRNFLTFRNHVYARHGSDAGKHPDETCTAQDDDYDSQTFSVVTNEEWLDSDLTDDENKSGQVDEEVTRVDYVSTIQKAAATWILKVYVQMHCHTKRSVS